MAEKKTNGAKTINKKEKKSGKMSLTLVMIVLGASLFFIMPTFVLVMCGMMPTLVAIFTDNNSEKSSSSAIGAMNCAGVVPFMIDLWIKGQTMENVFHILSQGSTWLVMLGAAGIGKLIVFVVPQATAALTLNRSEARIKILKQNLESLKQAWGPDVATTKPLDRVQRSE